MALQVIGAGLGRTGTESFKKAIEKLGFGKCYHMFELMKNIQHLPEWEKLEKGQKPDYEKLFYGYASTSDFPACIYYKEFLEQYPEAKVILTVRDANRWYDSARKTIFKPPPGFFLAIVRFLGIFSATIRSFPPVHKFGANLTHNTFFHGKIRDREHCISVYKEWNENVKRSVPSAKLLIYDVKEGWESLCKFLGVTVPDEPFPHANKGGAFRKEITKKIMKKKVDIGCFYTYV